LEMSYELIKNFLEEIVVRRADQKLYKFKEGDFLDLHLNDIEDMLLFIAQNKLFNLEGDVIVDFVTALKVFTRRIIIQNTVEDVQLAKEPYTSNFDPLGVIYENKSKKKRLMRVDEVHTFCDGTLQSVRNILRQRLQNFKLGYSNDMPTRQWKNKDKRCTCIMLNKINDQLLKRRIMISLEVLVGERKIETDVMLHSIHSDDGNPTSANIKQALRQMEMEIPRSSRVKFITTCLYSVNKYKDMMKAQKPKAEVGEATLKNLTLDPMKRRSIKPPKSLTTVLSACSNGIDMHYHLTRIKMMIEQYFLMTDYSLWGFILNGDSPSPTRVVDCVIQVVAPTTADQRLAIKNELKARDTLFMALSNKHQLKFNTHKDAKSLLEAIKKRFGGNKETKKNKINLKGQSLDDLFNNLKIYETKVKSLSSTSLTTQNIVFVSSQNTDSTNESVSVVNSVSAASTKVLVAALPNVDNLSDVVIYSFFASQSNSPQLDNDDLKQIDVDDLEEMDLKWHMVECYNCHRRGHFAKECSYDWSFQADKEPTNYALMIFTSLSSTSSSGSDSKVAPYSKACTKAYATLQSHYDKLTNDLRKSQFDILSYKTGLESIEARLVVYQQNENVFEEDLKLLKLNVMLRDNALVKLGKKFKKAEQEIDEPSAPIIEDWVSDSEDEYEVEHPTPAEHLRKDNLKSRVHRHSWKRKACFVCKSLNHLIKDCDYYEKKMVQKPIRNHEMKGNHQHYARMTHSHPNRHVVPTTVLTRSRLVPLTAARHVTTAIPQTNVTHQRATKHVVNQPHSLIRRPINHIPSPKYTNFHQKVTTVKANQVNAVQCVKGNWRSMEDMLPLVEIQKVVRSQEKMCNKKNNVFFTDTECIVLSFDFKLPDKNHVLLRVPRENNMYNVDLKNIVPSGDLTCLFAKATLDEVLVTKPYNKTPYELLLGRTPSIGFIRSFGCPVTIFNTLDPLGKFDGKADEGFLVGYSVSSKAFRVFNSRTRIVQETLHINFLENQPNIARSGPTWLFDIDTLTQSMNYQPVVVGNQPNSSVGIQENLTAGTGGKEAESVQQYVLLPLWSSGSKDPQNTNVADFEVKEPESEVHVSPSKFFVNSTNGVNAASTPITAVGPNSTNSTNSFSVASPSNTAVSSTFEIGGKSSFVDPSQYPDDLNMPALEDITYSDDEEDVGAEADFSNLETSITVSLIPTTRVHKDQPITQIIGDLSLAPQTRSMTRMVKDQGGLTQINDKDLHTCMFACFLSQEEPKREEGIGYEEVFALVALIEAIRLFLAYASFMGFMVYQMDVKSAFLYGTIEEEVYVCQPLGFEDPNYPDKNDFQMGKIDQTLFIKKQKGDILLIHVYVDDIIFGTTNKEPCKAFEKLMKDKFQVSSMGELTFFLGLQVKQKKDGIFINQDKYVAKILRKFGLTDRKSASTPIDTKKHLLKDPDDRKKVIIREDTIRQALRLDDVNSVDCLPNEEIFAELARMGYEKPSTKLTFYKAFFSAQWKFLIHTLLQCMSTKRRNEFSSFMASAVICLATEQDKIAQALEITKLKQRVRRLEKKRQLKTSGLKRLRKVGMAQRVESSANNVMDDQKDASKQEGIAELDANEDITLKTIDAKDVVTTATTITVVQVPKASAPRKRRVVVIHDPEETATPSDEAFARQLETELNANINWNDVVDHVKRKEKQDNTVMRYQVLKRKPVTEVHAIKNMIVYLKNMVGFKMDFFKDPVIKIDASNINNELAKTKYVEDIYKFYKLSETKGGLRDDMDSQHDISVKMRSVSVIISNNPSKLAASTVYAARDCAKSLVNLHVCASEGRLKAVLRKYVDPERSAVTLSPGEESGGSEWRKKLEATYPRHGGESVPTFLRLSLAGTCRQIAVTDNG
nr:hypothetical protein [Tanacetum cinerariifolium]